MTRRLTAAFLVAGAAAVIATALAGGAQTAKRPVAFWTLDARIACADASTCTVLPSWMKSLRNPMEITVFADGTMYFKAEVFAVGIKGPRRCDKTLFSKPFTGTCHVADFGVGFMKKTSIPGPYKGNDFWVESETALIGSNPAFQVNPFAPYPIDTGNAVWPGHHTLTDFDPKPAAGESLTLDVTRTPVG